MNHAHVTTLVGLNANLQIAHWRADTATNAHRTIGELYDAMVDLTDRLAECAMGKDGNIDFPKNEAIALNFTDDIRDLIGVANETFAAMRAELKAGIDDDLLNIVADMSAAVNKAKYLLKV